jgi:hypothetical protein
MVVVDWAGFAGDLDVVTDCDVVAFAESSLLPQAATNARPASMRIDS